MAFILEKIPADLLPNFLQIFYHLDPNPNFLRGLDPRGEFMVIQTRNTVDNCNAHDIHNTDLHCHIPKSSSFW
jgi:hypothetical protein